MKNYRRMENMSKVIAELKRYANELVSSGLVVMMSSMINLFIVLFVNTETAFSTVNTIIGTVLGFLCGSY